MNLVFSRVHPPRPLEPRALEHLLVRLASDPTHALVVFETRASPSDGISWWLGAAAEHLRWLRRTIRDLLPGTVIDPGPNLDRPRVGAAARVKVQPSTLALAVDRPEAVTAAILSSLHPRLLPGEQLVVQLVVGRRRSPRHPSRQLVDPEQRWWMAVLQGTRTASGPAMRHHQVRVGQAGMAVCMRVGVTAHDRARRGRLLHGVLAGLSTAKAPGTFMSLRAEPARRLDEARAPRWWGFTPAAAELVGLLAWPLGDDDLPGLPPLHPRVLPVARSTDEAQRTIGISSVPGNPKTAGLSASDGLFHLVATGPTGSGKSNVLLRLIGADVRAGRPVVVIDPKRQLVDDIVARAVPAERIEDVVLIDPSENQVPGFNPLDIGERDPDVVVDGLLAVFAAVFSEGWGPRTQDITHAGLASLARVGSQRQRAGEQPFSLLDLPRLFTDASFRRSVVGHVATDPALGAFWAWYDSLSPQAQSAAIAAPMNKWRQYLLRPSLRRLLGQTQPRFRLRDVFAEEKIVLVALNEGLIGPLTAQLLGGLIVAELWAATLERAREDQPTARPASLWIDEAQNFLCLPTSLDDALAASRSMGVSWNLAHQFRAQMPAAMLAAIDSNARNKIVFRPGDPKDAVAYARMAPQLEPIDFLSLGQYAAYATLVTDGEQQPWCSIRTLPPDEPTGLVSQIRAASRERFGTPEQANVKQPAPVAAPAVVGRKRRGGA